MTVTASPVGVPTPAQFSIFASGSQSHRLSRHSFTAGDAAGIELFLAVPRHPEGSVNLLYLLDGNAAFDELLPELLEASPDLALAGIGYDTPLRFDVLRRSRDYTPPLDASYPRLDPKRPERTIGGADAFIDLLVGQVRGAVEQHLPTPVAKRFLWGHSLAGLCSLYCMLKHPSTFDGFAAASPSLWWGDEFLLRWQAGQGGLQVKMPPCLVMLGDSEKRSSPTGPHWDGPAPHTLELVERLRSRNQKVSLEIFEGLGHAATLARSLPSALAFAATKVGTV